MSSNSIGKIFNFTTWGESHGKAIGCVVDGVPSKIPLNEKDLQKYLDKRRPWQTKYTSQRKEADQVEILSGIFEGFTTGHPISLIIMNQDQRSKDYSEIKDIFRPGHADYTYWSKYGIRDYRGGGRSSARETAMRVAAGAIARLILGKKISLLGAVTQIGSKKIKKKNWDTNFIKKNDLFCPDSSVYEDWKKYITSVRKSGSSCGAQVEVVVKGVPAGLGEPIYGKLDAELASALMSINAVKGIEIGSGFKVVGMSGEQNSDEISIDDNENINFLSNNSGGILGGISSGQDIICKLAVKPTSSILKNQKTINIKNENTLIKTKGRHDPCVGIRCVPVAEAMIALVLADQLLRDKAQNENRNKD